jgi:hypothetical protein
MAVAVRGTDCWYESLTEVKPCRSDGTAACRWESRSLPEMRFRTWPASPQGGDRGHGHRGGLLETQGPRRGCEQAEAHARILRQGPVPARGHVPEHLVTGPAVLHAPANGLHGAGEIRPEEGVPGPGEPAAHESHEEHLRAQAMPIVAVHGHGADSHQDLIVTGKRHFDVLQAEDVGGAVAVVSICLHAVFDLARPTLLSVQASEVDAASRFHVHAYPTMNRVHAISTAAKNA